jgi:hypothetical protein
LQFSNIIVSFLPPNVTCAVQPLKKGNNCFIQN